MDQTFFQLFTVCFNIVSQSSASVERRFSMLRKILDKERNFWIENVKYYLILHFNACMWQMIVGQLLYLENFCAFYLIQCLLLIQKLKKH